MSELKQIYFVAAPAVRMMKIGISADPTRRLAWLQTWSPVPLELRAYVPGTTRDENFLQTLLVCDWSHLEWFHTSDFLEEIVRYAARHKCLPAYASAPSYWMRQRLPHQDRRRFTEPNYRSDAQKRAWQRKRLDNREGLS